MNKNKSEGKEKKTFTDSNELKKLTILIPVIIYELFSVIVSYCSRSDEVIMLGDNTLPISAFSGVISSFSLMCLIITVLLYKKMGYIVALVIDLIQIPPLIIGMSMSHNLRMIPGLFLNISTVLTITIIYLSQAKVEREKKRLRSLFEQTAVTLVGAIDAKDTYTHGHSSRVAEYSRKLAEMKGMSEKQCDEIYYTALLHDVGKIGVPENIINKPGKLTDEEFEYIKQHPGQGAQILEKINEYPFLSIGAHFHHERYDGRGYPEEKKGYDIPENARIISVADAYDAMTSKRSYRDPMPQEKVREQIEKGIGTQFDPEYAKLMLKLIDADKDYDMREKD